MYSAKRPKWLWLFSVVMIVAMALPVFSAPTPVLAQDGGDGEDDPAVVVEFEGYVQYVDAELAVIDGFVVYAGGDVDLSTLAVGDYVMVAGEMNADGSITATSITPTEAPEDDGEDEEGEEITVVGRVESLGDDEIIIAGYIVAPAGAFNPSTLEVGDLVVLTGILLGDGETIQATSLTILPTDEEDECEDEDDGTDDGTDGEGEDDGTDDGTDGEDGEDDGTDDGTDGEDAEDPCAEDDEDEDECEEGEDGEDDGTDDGTDDGEDGEDDGTDDGTDGEDAEDPCAEDDEDDEDDETSDGCPQDENNPVAARLAEAYDVSIEQIREWRCDRHGYGNIARALALAELTGDDAGDILARHSAGEGWGQIMRDYDVHPSELAPGRAISGRDAECEEAEDGEDDEDDGRGRGRGRGGDCDEERGGPPEGRGPKDKDKDKDKGRGRD